MEIKKSKAIFVYNGNTTIIQCNLNDKMKEICQKFSSKLQIDLNNLFFLYNGNKINNELTFQQLINKLDSNKNEMNILAFDSIDNDIKNENMKRSKEIICPQCNDQIFITFNDYIVNLKNCLNGHNLNNVNISEFDKTQYVDFSKIKCNNCNNNKANSYNNEFYLCLECRIKLCPLCKSNHDRKHHIINYDQKDYICIKHNNGYIKYCNECRENFCLKCEKEHKGHNNIYFGSILFDEDELITLNNELKEKINKFNKDSLNLIENNNFKDNNMLNKENIKELIKNIEIYYNQFNDLINIYNDNNSNYQIIYNIDKFIKNNKILEKDLNSIINEKNINTKFNNLKNLYFKIINKDIQSNTLTDIEIFSNFVIDFCKKKHEMRYDYDEIPSIIIDNGSTNIRAGLSSSEYNNTIRPLIELESCIGYPKDEYKNEEIKDLYLIGKAAEDNKKYLDKIIYPIKRGKIKEQNDWDNLEKIYTHIFENELVVDPYDHKVFISEIPLNYPKENREKLAQIMFETFNVSGLYIQDQAVLSLYAYGKTDGIVVDLSDSYTHFYPISDGYTVKNNVKYLNIGGRDLTEFMLKLLIQENGHDINIDYRDAKNIKEKVCFVAMDYFDEIKYVDSYEYELPDGTHLNVKNARIQCPEVLFNPELMEKTGESISTICNDTIKIDPYLMKDLYRNIFLSGGNSMFIGFPERFTKEIKDLAPENMKENVKVIVEVRDLLPYLPYIGCNILSSIKTSDSLCISRTEYEDFGNSIIHKKCPL